MNGGRYGERNATRKLVPPSRRVGRGSNRFNPGILGGKPINRGTRISVEFILEVLASGSCIAEIVKIYPHLQADAVRDAILFAASSLKDDIFLSVDLP